MGYEKPLPTIGADNRPYWSAAHRHELRHPKCISCGYIWGPPSGICPGCLSEEVDWPLMSGRGRLVSWNTFHRAYDAAFRSEVPYNVALVELDEGPRLITNIVSTDDVTLAIGMPLQVVFDDVTDEVTLVKFRPIGYR